MELLDAMKSRHSVRAFKPESVKRSVILDIIKNANYAPSWANSQPWEIFVADGNLLDTIREKFLNNFYEHIPRKPDITAPTHWPPAHQQRIEELRSGRIRHLEQVTEEKVSQDSLSEANFKFFGAPSVIYICMHKELNIWSLFDIGTFAQNIMLAAREFSLDTIPAYNLVAYPDILRSEINIPDNLSIVIGLAIGYENNKMPINEFRSQRRLINEVVRFID